VTVSLSHLPGTEDADEKMVMPGDSIEMVGELVHDVALETGSRFTLREGGKTGECWRWCALRDSLADPTPAVGTGIVTKLG
jgi:hypothetical protein